jgi:structural maintenance of chromosomes protein 5
LKRLDTTDVKKLGILAKWDQNTHDAVLWLRRNRDKFRMEVFEPPILSVSVSDSNNAAYAEAGFNAIQMKVSPKALSWN